jgi:integrase
MRAKITKRTVDATQAGARDTFIWDTETRGFGLKVTPVGNRIYVLQARLNGKPIRCTIGKHGSPWTPDKAREEAVRRLGQIASGTNPNAAKTEAKRDISVSQLSDLYLSEGCNKKRPSTVYVERGLIKRHIKPLLGRCRVKSLSRADIERFMANVAAGKTATDERTGKRGRAIVRGGTGAANRTTDLLASMLTFAVHRGLRPDSPVRGVKKYRLQPRERFLSPKELAMLGEVLTRAEADALAVEKNVRQGRPRKSGRKGRSDPPAGENPYAVAAIRLLTLTGCRKNEILSLRWDWVDFERAALRLPDSKTGAKVIPLGAPALQVLHALPRIESNPHVFPSAKGEGHLIGLQKIWARIRAQAELQDVRLHDLRHSFASVGAAGGDSLYVIGKLLGHAQSRTTERYSHLADDPLRAAADRIAGQIAAAMKGDDRAAAIELKRRA